MSNEYVTYLVNVGKDDFNEAWQRFNVAYVQSRARRCNPWQDIVKLEWEGYDEDSDI